jgi:UDP-N-acetylglucosamine diphosphorylase/glucosamine-1-phosphate N-acetyltransferase
MKNELNVIIMAGGLGKRMESSIPKVLHKILNKPMIVHVIEQSIKLNPKKIMIVVGKYRAIIENTIKEYLDISVLPVIFIFQKEALGTGHAVQCCIESIQNDVETKTIILSGDVPLLKCDTMNSILEDINKVKIATTELENSTGYGRIVEKNGIFDKIVEEKDCSKEQKFIKKINCGIYAFDTEILCKYLPYLSNNNSQNEYYLTDIIEIIKINENINIDLYNISKEKHHEIIGINTKEQLLELEKLVS